LSKDGEVGVEEALFIVTRRWTGAFGHSVHSGVALVD
jgi:hypothetical protein